MKFVKTGLIAAFCLLLLSAMHSGQRTDYTTRTVAGFTKDGHAFSESLNALKKSVAALKPHDAATKAAAIEALKPHDAATKAAAIEALKQCRMQYKRIEYFMEYFFEYPVNLYNRAPVYEVEEPYAEYQSPIGLQVVEGMLMEDDPYEHKKELTDECEVLATTAADIPAQLYSLQVDDRQILEGIRLELVRIITLGITGYDAPQLKTGMPEAAEALEALQHNLSILFETQKGAYADSTTYYLQRSIALLKADAQFDHFDRLGLLTNAMLPLQRCFSHFVADAGLDLNTHEALSHQAEHIFRRNAIDLNTFQTKDLRHGNEQLAALGKKLFFEQQLSGNGKRSCATCHRPDKAFTDGLAKSKALDELSFVTRNAPTLYYAAYQHAQFYDGRAASLEKQIEAVLQNKHEMDASLQQIVVWLNNETDYKEQFRKAYNLTEKDTITIPLLTGALAAFERTLTPFSSPFDRCINGAQQAMTAEQKQGFNLFMGKAQCGTCHFAPLFNGLLPPYYERTESEVLGVPQNNSRRHAIADTDSGRYNFFAISFNNGAFKTSTVRNAAATAPYMHNGVFTTLDEVIDFYNRGGGKGLKLKIENQTLSDKPLGLTKKEKKAIIAFLNALTDEPLDNK